MARTSVKAKHSTGGNAPHRPLGIRQGAPDEQKGSSKSPSNSGEVASMESLQPVRPNVTAGLSESQEPDRSEVCTRTNESLHNY